MHSAIADVNTAVFLGSACVGFVITTAILTVRGLAIALAGLLLVALLGVFVLDGPIGFGRWLGLGEAFMIGNGTLCSGIALGKLLASILVSACRRPTRMAR